jgi:hypothetical protein
MLTMKLTRYFTCEGVNAAYTLSWDVLSHSDPLETIRKFRTMEVVLPPMGDGATWREMTDEEAREYLEEEKRDQEEARRARMMADEDEDY